ncbi:MAG TPA: lipid-A-disaccharide synthase [Steroidobacteraceae bacterium]|nr:lipid-A-disaccharide synthase [Steroidobacteraceae bacterium]
MSMPLRVGLVAGEASGDTLGAGLIHALRRLAPDTEFFGVAGPKMQVAGCEVWEPSESLAVMGLFEIVRELPRLFRLRARIRRDFIEARPDVFVGIDAPEFNLRLARDLRRAGIPTVQYVSPQVWAWRQNRVRTMHESVDLMLCLLPFEKRFYDGQGMPAEFVGHPLADAIPLTPDRSQARATLSLAADAQIVALLPGSRRGEVSRLAEDFARTAQWMAAQRPNLVFVAPMASHAVRNLFEAALERIAPAVPVTLLDGHAQTALTAADVVLVASGTASLEAALCKRPMVVVYRLGRMTAWILRHLNLVKSKFFAQPNLLADRRVVGEYFQQEIIPESIGAELLMWLDDKPRREALEHEFLRIHLGLKCDASARAAQGVFALASRRRLPAAGGSA